MPSAIREELVAQGVVGADEGLDALPVLGQRGLRGSEDGDDRVLLLEKNLAAELAREPRHPRLDGPSRVHVAAGEEEHELRVLRRDDLGVAAVDGHLQAAFAQPDAGVYVLRVAELRGGKATADKVLRSLQSEARAHDEGVTAAGDRGQHAEFIPLGAHVGVDDRRRPDVGQVDGSGQQGLHRGGAGVERAPLDLGTLRQVREVPIGAFALELARGQGRRVGEVREEPDAEGHRGLLGGPEERGGEQNGEGRQESHGRNVKE